jgi:hypothetical protein
MKKVLKKSGVEGYRTNLAKVKKRYQEMGGDKNWFKPKVGKSRIRILPPWGPTAEGVFYLEGGLHYGFKIGGQDRAIPCKVVSNKGPCPICELHDALVATDDEDYKGLISRIRVKKKFWVNVIEKDPKSGEVKGETVQMFGGNKKFIDAVMGAMDDEDYGDITDPTEGHDLIIERVGTTMTDTRYEYRVKPNPSPIGLEDWQNKMHKLDAEVLEWMSWDEMVSHLKANCGDALGELGIQFKTSGSKPLKKKLRKEEEEEEELPEGDTEEDEDEEEEEE